MRTRLHLPPLPASVPRNHDMLMRAAGKGMRFKNQFPDVLKRKLVKSPKKMF